MPLTRLLRLLTTVLATAIGLLLLAAPAEARVSIVPGTVKGGGTETFAFRLANERSDTTSNRFELIFPKDVPIAFVEVAPVKGWTATITPRNLDTPIQVGDRTITQVAGSIVLEGGSVGPRQFEQFLITMGPLPADGRLVFDAVQGFAGGAVERWTDAAPGSPAITVSAVAGQGDVFQDVPANQIVDSPSGQAEQTPAEEGADGGGGGMSTLAVVWGALGFAAAIVALAGLRAYLRRPRQEQVPDEEKLDSASAEDQPDEASAAEVMTK